jgi:hypothetical protein
MLGPGFESAKIKKGPYLQAGPFFSPRNKQYANRQLSIIEDNLKLPPILKIKSKSFLEKLYYSKENLSIREIAKLTKTSHSTILLALSKLGIPLNGNGHKHKGQIPFGFGIGASRAGSS